MRSRLSLILVLAALSLRMSPASAGVVRGVLRVPPTRSTAAAASAYPGRASSLPGARSQTRGAVTDAVLSIDRIPAATDSSLAATLAQPRLIQRDQAFSPRVLPIAVGTVVEFPNQDPIYHNVFSVSPVRRFDLGKYPRGHSKSIPFTKIGLVNVYCDIHSDMAAFILVLPNHAFTQPAADGSFEIRSLPAGHYSLRIWHPDLGTLQRDVDVPRSGDVALDLAF